MKQPPAEPLWDDPTKDYRQRYELPNQFLWDHADYARIDFDGYMGLVLDLLPPPPARVIDVGCGPGMGSKAITERGYSVVGIDYSERAIDFARILVPEADFHYGDVRLLGEMTHLHRQFDVATLVEVIEHIPPQYHHVALQGIRGLLAPGGDADPLCATGKERHKRLGLQAF